MDQLVAQNIEAVENEAEDARAVSGLERLCERFGGRLEAILPILETVDTIVVLPERIEDIAIFQKHADRSGKPLPDCLVNTAC